MRPLVTAVVVLLAATGCAADSGGRATLRVLADAALAEVFADLTAVYHQHTPHVAFRLDVGTRDLADEVEHADVVATSDTASLEPVRKDLGTPHIVASNALTIAVAPGNPQKLTGVRSLSRQKLRVVLGTSVGPLGRYSREVLTKAGVPVRIRSEEVDSRAVLSLVRAGRADAGLVYITDMKTAGAAASSVAIPAVFNVKALFPVAPVAGSRHLPEATAFVAWLTGAEARALFHKYGFQAP
ncbi:extracellular solute-binding protein [Actinocorallia sp. API 0066]|uniref:extracellular solute-binding protein n=1 Tax=Actinocorallia sp. API 0066 TaxID=2896846 RepID=UPI001E396597|nr:extracellular solute-binding protein [Actinocorallia sp. API 0066]MCD0453611.1 extracellular solute-binding protein [Actinocorallia sp. API 0066]